VILEGRPHTPTPSPRRRGSARKYSDKRLPSPPRRGVRSMGLLWRVRFMRVPPTLIVLCHWLKGKHALRGN